MIVVTNAASRPPMVDVGTVSFQFGRCLMCGLRPSGWIPVSVIVPVYSFRLYV